MPPGGRLRPQHRRLLDPAAPNGTSCATNGGQCHGGSCSCPTGYSLANGTCTPIDSCLIHHGGCNGAAVCTSTGPGQNVCGCNPGYTGDGKSCTPGLAITGVTDGEITNAASVTPVIVSPAPVTAALAGAPFLSGTAVAAEGDHLLAATAADAFGNQKSATVHFSLDRTPPAVVIAGVSDGELRAAPATISFSATDAHLASAAATLDGAPFASGGTVASEGLHQVVVTAADAAGNSAVASVTFRIVLTPPAIVVVAPSDGAYLNTATASVVAQVTDQGGGIAQVQANGVAMVFSTGAFRADLPLLEGVNTIAVAASDLVGNRSQVTLSVMRDTTPPAINLTSPADGAHLAAASVQVVGVATDASPLVVRVDGAPVSPSFATTVALTPGANLIVVFATDAAGNSSTVTRQVRSNTVPPALAVLSPPDGLITSQTTIAVSGTAPPGDSADTLSVTIDGAPAALTGAAFSGAVSPPEGDHTIVVTAKDSYGLSAQRQIHLTRDTTPPVIAISGVADGEIRTSPVSISFSASDAHLSSVSATLDGAPFASGGTVKSAGPHALAVLASDAAGNASAVYCTSASPLRRRRSPSSRLPTAATVTRPPRPWSRRSPTAAAASRRSPPTACRWRWGQAGSSAPRWRSPRATT